MEVTREQLEVIKQHADVSRAIVEDGNEPTALPVSHQRLLHAANYITELVTALRDEHEAACDMSEELRRGGKAHEAGTYQHCRYCQLIAKWPHKE